MSKQIVIIGGGISGLALLHFLKHKYAGQDDVVIQLLEKNDSLGGTICSIRKNDCLFETGPNGFLDSKPRTLEFIKELGLEASLVRADEQSKIRYLSVNNRLHVLPMNPGAFLSFSLLNPIEKLRVLGEFFQPRQDIPMETVYDFGERRLGEKFSQIFLDPMVSGVYGGDARQAVLKAVFPRIHEIEQEYGSLFKGLIKIRKQKKAQNKDKGSMGGPSGTLTSFRAGVLELIEAVWRRYPESICLNQEVRSIEQQSDQYRVFTANGSSFDADELFVSAPAYAAASMVKDIDPVLSGALERIEYAPMAVVGLVYNKSDFSKLPRGYGYLVPSTEHKEILGVLFEGNIFPGRCREDQVLFRMMIGGARHPDILRKSKDALLSLAQKEIGSLGFLSDVPIPPVETFFIPWSKAIPQYNARYCASLNVIEERLAQRTNLHLVANYLKGVSLNDCIESAYQATAIIT